MTHKIKLLEKYADNTLAELQTYEIYRTKNDRNYQVGDVVIFAVVDDNGKMIDHAINDAFFYITYILKGPVDVYSFLGEGYVVFAVKQISRQRALGMDAMLFMSQEIERARKEQGKVFTVVLDMLKWNNYNLFVPLDPYSEDLGTYESRPIDAWREQLEKLSSLYHVRRVSSFKWIVSGDETTEEFEVTV